MAYVFLLLAIGAEVAGTSLLPASNGFTRPLPTAGSLAAYAVAFVLLAQAVREIPVGTAYAMWSGLGTVAVVAIATTVLGQPLTATTVVGVALVVVGVVVLNLGGAH